MVVCGVVPKTLLIQHVWIIMNRPVAMTDICGSLWWLIHRTAYFVDFMLGLQVWIACLNCRYVFQGGACVGSEDCEDEEGH